LLRAISRTIEAEYPRARIHIDIEPQYRNMAEGLKREPRAVRLAERAVRRIGLTPKFPVLRGGTDGARLTELGLPTPNLSTGEHNPHSPLEWTSLEDMESAVRMLIELARLWGEEGWSNRRDG
jgi:tripeptide aminopeptidase